MAGLVTCQECAFLLFFNVALGVEGATRAQRWVFRHRRRRFVLRRPRGETRGTAAESALVSLRGGGDVGGSVC